MIKFVRVLRLHTIRDRRSDSFSALETVEAELGSRINLGRIVFVVGRIRQGTRPKAKATTTERTNLITKRHDTLEKRVRRDNTMCGRLMNALPEIMISAIRIFRHN